MMKSCCMKKFLIVFLVVVSVAAYADQYGNGGDHQDADVLENSYATFENFPNLSSYDDVLSFSYYQKSCPDFEAIVHKKVDEWIQKDYTLAPSLIRLHYQDCVVRGCDASILLEHEGSEMTANSSKSLRGFEVIEDIKQEIEKKCPKIVSCSDILTSAVREAVLKIGGPFYMVPYGRKDGKISLAKDVESLPVGREKITDLIEFFQSKGLCVLDLVVLLGAHTIGRTTCGSLQNRLYNFNGTAGQCDPTIDPKYANFLKRKCRWASEYVDFDGFSPQAFNNEYYKNLQRNMALLATDQLLYKDSRTAGLVNALASQPELFHAQFAASMVKLGMIQEGDDDDDGGEVRVKCSSINV